MNMFTTYCSGEMFLIQHYVIKFVSDLQQDGGFSKYSGFCHDNWNIVGSGIKHHKPPQPENYFSYRVDIRV